MTISRKIAISCGICNEEFIFDMADDRTFLSMEDSGNPLIGKLHTYRIVHEKNEDGKIVKHLNTVVIDTNGEYRAHKDSFILPESLGSEIEQLDDYFKNQKLIMQRCPIDLTPHIEKLSPQDLEILLEFLPPAGKHLGRESFGTFLMGCVNVLESVCPEMIKPLDEPVEKEEFFDFTKIEKISNAFLYLTVKGLFFNLKRDMIEAISSRIQFPPINLVNVRTSIIQGDITTVMGELSFLEKEVDNSDLLADGEWCVTKAEYLERSNRLSELLRYLTQITEKPIFAAYHPIIQGEIWLKLSVAQSISGFPEKAEKNLEKALYICAYTGSNRLNALAFIEKGLIEQRNGQFVYAKKSFEDALEASASYGDPKNISLAYFHLGDIYLQEGKFNDAVIVFEGCESYSEILKDERLFLLTRSKRAQCLFHLGEYEQAINMALQTLGDAKRGLMNDLQLQLFKILSEMIWSRTELQEKYDILSVFEEQVNALLERISGNSTCSLAYEILGIIAITKKEMNTALDKFNKSLKLAQKAQITQAQIQIHLRLSYVYAELSAQSTTITFLQKAYNHLDLAQILSRDTGHVPLQVDVSLLRVLLYESQGQIDQAIKQLDFTIKLCEKNNLPTHKEKVEKIKTIILKEEKRGQEKLRSNFKSLIGLIRLPERSRKGKKRKIDAVFIIEKGEILFTHAFARGEIYQEFIQGFSAALSLYWEQIEDLSFTDRVWLTEEKTIMITQGKKYYLIGITNYDSFDLREALQTYLQKIEEKWDAEKDNRKVLSYAKEKITLLDFK
ncbi:MAG: tetratricopeptide repeat protein [Candidatus Kariarchaeaceae archaeon]